MSKQDYQDLLKPEWLGTVSGLSLISRIAVEGYTSGLNRSLKLGPGMEFSQYRGYQAGDDPRLLDWKMLARSGRYYIKESEQESLVTVKFIVDASASMEYREEGMSKAENARLLVAALAYLAFKQGDSVGLYALNEKELVSVYPAAGKRQYYRLLTHLLGVTNTGKWPEHSRAIRRIPHHDRRELVFFLTDMYENDKELTRFARSLKTPRNEVVVLQLMGRAEMEFDYGRPLTFEDLETGVRVQVDAGKARKAYLQKLKTRFSSIREELLGQGIGYHLFRMDTPLDQALHQYLKERSRLN
jgi:uncharacterized protein (DUF58 family)